jgi:hypothetical protein
MKTIILIACAALLAMSQAPAQTVRTDPGVHFSAKMRLSPRRMRAGGSGKVTISLSPGKNMHINAVPAPEFLPDSGCAVMIASRVRIGRTTNGRVEPNFPIRTEFSVPRGTHPGTYLVGGTLRCYVCSDSEGWGAAEQRHVAGRITVTR